MLFTLPDAATDTTIVSKELHLHNAVINNVKSLDKNDKWRQLQFLEAYYIKKLAPELISPQKHQKNYSYFVPRNVGLICNVGAGTSSGNLGTNYAMLTP